MKLAIHHETVYTYAAPVSYTIQLLRLTPRQNAQQRVLEWTIEAPGRRHRHLDAYGNASHTLVVTDPHATLRVVAHGVVETRALPDGRIEDEPHGDDLPREAFVVHTPMTAADDDVGAFARQALPEGLRHPGDALRLAAAIRDRVAYVSGATEVDTPAADALRLGRGVCQDHAHLFLAVARLLGVPCRYVSGYIHPGDTHHAASHAWVDVWYPQAGWTSVDVTHARFASDWHCRIALGRDYESAGPVRGVRTGGGRERMDIKVRVTSLGQTATQQ